MTFDLVGQLIAVIAALVGVLFTVIGWMGGRVFQRIDELSEDISQIGREVARLSGIIER